MSGRSGYGRSRIVGKLIHRPANMMMAGLAPRVGKSGASIRLYYQRVDGCCDFCDPEPIQILKRGIFPGDVVSGNWSNNTGSGPIINSSSRVVIDLGQNGRLTNVQYVVVFNRELTSTYAVNPPAGATLEFRTPLSVDWSTGVPVNQTIYPKTIPIGDFKILDFGNTTALAPNNTDIGKSTSGWQISLDGSTNTTNGPGVVPVGGGGILGSSGSINYNQLPIGGGLNVGLSSLAGNMLPNNGSMAYLITNTTHFGGYAIVFNITRLVIAAISDTTVSANWDSYNASNGSLRNKWRQNLANITWFNSNTPPNRNNIGITYTPNEKTALTNTDNCGFAVPIAPFKISIGDIVNPTNLPILTLIDNANW